MKVRLHLYMVSDKTLGILLRFLLMLLLFYSIQCVSAQQVRSTNLFKEGISLDALDLQIPWLVDLRDINTYMPNKKYQIKYFIRTEWDSVSLFGSINVRLLISFSKNSTYKKLENKMTRVFCLVKPEYEQKIKTILDSCTGNPAILIKKRKRYSYHWLINNCLVELGYNKKFNIGNYLTVTMSAYKIKQRLSL
ncbi:MAG TPA: hypothetical protein VGP55_01910 [Chitinophagaceae bacterium]|nr:hypothetical protein [Chitinophagaceae bacterium]